MNHQPPLPTYTDVEEAARRIATLIHRTPILTNAGVDNLLEAQVFFKCENFQRVGAFKFRGACNAVFSLEDEHIRNGVATHSSGNHAAALALAAKLRGVPAFVVMPLNSSSVKIEAVKSYGAEIIFCEPTLEARESMLEQVVARTNASFVHPYNNRFVIAGQATAAKELCESVPGLDMLIAPVGGGGLLSGSALSTRALSPVAMMLGAEPEGADDAARSLREGRIIPAENPQTIADGLRTSLGSLTFEIIKSNVHAIHTAPDSAIIDAMRLIWQRMKIIVEPSSAVPLAILLFNKIATKGKRIGIILSGGNVDLDHLPW